jgi:hypothetical protein
MESGCKLEMAAQDFQPTEFTRMIQRKFQVMQLLYLIVLPTNEPTMTEGETANVHEEEIPFNLPATDQASVVSTSTTTAESLNTSFKNIRPLPLKETKRNRSQETEG